jgi:tetratricopeptide (TPR) repeat protein
MNRAFCSRVCFALISAGIFLFQWNCVAYAQIDTYQRALSLFKAKEFSKAAEQFTLVEADSPGATDALLYKGKCLANLGDFPGAEAALRTYLERHPDSVDSLAFLGFVLHRENKPKESLDFYNRAAKFEIPHGDDLKIVALDYVQMNDLLDAVKWLQRCTQMEPSNSECWYYLGRAYFTDGRFREAKPAFQQALALSPRDSKAEDYLGLILESENRTDEAIQAYKNSIAWQTELKRKSEHPYLHLAMLFDRQGRSDQSIAPLLDSRSIPRVHCSMISLGRC